MLNEADPGDPGAEPHSPVRKVPMRVTIVQPDVGCAPKKPIPKSPPINFRAKLADLEPPPEPEAPPELLEDESIEMDPSVKETMRPKLSDILKKKEEEEKAKKQKQEEEAASKANLKKQKKKKHGKKRRKVLNSQNSQKRKGTRRRKKRPEGTAPETHEDSVVTKTIEEHVRVRTIAQKRQLAQQEAEEALNNKNREIQQRIERLQEERIQKSYQQQLKDRQKAERIAKAKAAVQSTKDDSIAKALARNQAVEMRRIQLSRQREEEIARRNAALWLKKHIAEQQRQQDERRREHRLMLKMEKEKERERKLSEDRIEKLKRRQKMQRTIDSALRAIL